MHHGPSTAILLEPPPSHLNGLRMATRRSTDDDDSPARRRHVNDELRPKIRKKRKRKTADRHPILLFVLFGSAAVVLLAVGAIVIIRSITHREQNSAGGAAGRPGSESGSGSSARLGAELLTNGNFEDGPEPDPAGRGFTPYEAGSTAIPGWTITRGSVDYIGPYWQHADGRRSIDLNGNEPGAIAQTIRTRPGRKYRVTFGLAGNAFVGAEPAVKLVVVSAAGAGLSSRSTRPGDPTKKWGGQPGLGSSQRSRRKRRWNS